MRDVLVTGAAGFIGSHVAEALIEEGHRVVAADDLSGGYGSNVPRDAVFRKVDIRNKVAVKALFEEFAFDVVFHLASYAAEGLSHHIKCFNYETNLLGSVNVLNGAVNSGVSRFVFTSSIAVYGSTPPPMAEHMTPVPMDPYAIAKYATEMELEVTKRVFGLDYVVLRLHNVYGERQNLLDRYRNVIGIFMNQMMTGHPLTVFGDGTQRRAFTHVSDVVPTIVRSAWDDATRNQVLNIGSCEPTTVNGLVEILKKAWRIDDYPVKHLRARSEVQDAWCDHTKARDLLGYEARCSLEEGLLRMAQWAKSKGPGEPQAFQGIEIAQGLPEGWAKG